MSSLYEYEIGKSADILCRELFKLKSGEIFAITCDTESDARVVEAAARAAFAVGAKPLVMRVASRTHNYSTEERLCIRISSKWQRS